VEHVGIHARSVATTGGVDWHLVAPKILLVALCGEAIPANGGSARVERATCAWCVGVVVIAARDIMAAHGGDP